MQKHIPYSFFLLIVLVISCTESTKKHETIESANLVQGSDTIFSSTTDNMLSDTIPSYVFKMEHLHTLGISGMDCSPNVVVFNAKGQVVRNCLKIKSIPTQVENLTELTTLALTDNDITSLPNELAKLKKLKILGLQNNYNLRDVEVLAKMTSLKELYLYGCHLPALPDSIGNLQQLKLLTLDGYYMSKEEQKRIKKALPNCAIYF